MDAVRRLRLVIGDARANRTRPLPCGRRSDIFQHSDSKSYRRTKGPQALDAALRHADRLDDRDRRLVEAAHDFFEGRADEAERRYRAILAEYPGELDAQFQLASLLLVYNPMRGRPVGEARAPFDAVLAADPKFICPI